MAVNANISTEPQRRQFRNLIRYFTNDQELNHYLVTNYQVLRTDTNHNQLAKCTRPLCKPNRDGHKMRVIYMEISDSEDEDSDNLIALKITKCIQTRFISLYQQNHSPSSPRLKRRNKRERFSSTSSSLSSQSSIDEDYQQSMSPENNSSLSQLDSITTLPNIVPPQECWLVNEFCCQPRLLFYKTPNSEWLQYDLSLNRVTKTYVVVYSNESHGLTLFEKNEKYFIRFFENALYEGNLPNEVNSLCYTGKWVEFGEWISESWGFRLRKVDSSTWVKLDKGLNEMGKYELIEKEAHRILLKARDGGREEEFVRLDWTSAVSSATREGSSSLLTIDGLWSV